MIVLRSTYRKIERELTELRGKHDASLSVLASYQVRAATAEGVVRSQDEMIAFLRNELTVSEADRRELALRQPMTPPSKTLFSDDPFKEEMLGENEFHQYVSPGEGEVLDMNEVIERLDQPRENPEQTA